MVAAAVMETAEVVLAEEAGVEEVQPAALRPQRPQGGRSGGHHGRRAAAAAYRPASARKALK